MPEIKFSDVAEFLGIDAKSIDSIDKFKESFEKDFLRVSTLTGNEEAFKPLFGKKIGEAEARIKSFAKKHNAEWGAAKDWDGKPLQDKVEFVLNKIVSDSNLAIEEAKKSDGMGNDEKVAEWQDKYTKLESKYKDTDSLLKTVKTEYDGFKVQKEQELKGMKLNMVKDEAIKKMKFKQGLSDIEKRGFLSKLNDDYKIDLDDKGEPYIADKEGNRIKNPKVTGTFKGIDDVLLDLATKEKLIEMNPHAGSKAPNYSASASNGQSQQNIPEGNAMAPRYVHPSAIV